MTEHRPAEDHVIEDDGIDVDGIDVDGIDVDAIDVDAIEVDAVEVDAIEVDAGLARLTARRRAGVLVIEVVGELDVTNVGALEALASSTLAADDPDLVLDLTGTAYLDSSGIALVVAVAEALQAKRCRLALVAPAGSRPRRVFELSGLASSLDLHETRDSTAGRRPG